MLYFCIHIPEDMTRLCKHEVLCHVKILEFSCMGFNNNNYFIKKKKKTQSLVFLSPKLVLSLPPRSNPYLYCSPSDQAIRPSFPTDETTTEQLRLRPLRLGQGMVSIGAENVQRSSRVAWPARVSTPNPTATPTFHWLGLAWWTS